MCVCVCVTCVSAGSIQAGKCDIVLSCICPVDAIVDKIQCQAVGPGDLLFHNNTPVGAVHPDPPYVRVVAPVGPV